MTDARTALKEDLARGYRIFGALGWGDLGDGHISGRDPERRDCFWLLRYGVPFPEATTEDLVLVGPEGELVEGNGDINRPGFYIHQPILAARADVVSAAHTHTQWGTPFCAEVRPIEPITQEACIFFENAALFDDEEVQVQGLDAGARLAQSLGRNRALLLRNHGPLTVGASVAESVVWFAMLERVAEAHLKATNPRPISPAAARFARDDLTREGTARSVFEFLGRHHRVW